MATNRKNKSKPKSKHPDIDIQMLRDNLKRAPAERIRRHQIAVEMLNKLRKAGIKVKSARIDTLIQISELISSL